MALILAVILSALALSCSGQLVDELIEYERECLGEDKFLCLGGTCIPQEQYCNGVMNCPDGSDEDFCLNHAPDAKLCNLMHHYLCKDGKKCIPISWLCNNYTDCDDGSDEQGCSSMPAPMRNATCKGFQCDGGKCISNLWVCDGYYDCEDKTDENSEELCRKTLFPHSLHDVSMCTEVLNTGVRNYKCEDSSFCLPQSMMCDGVRDCRDGSDEGRFCDHWKTMCSNDTNPCKGNNTRCVPDRSGPSCICTLSPAMQRYNNLTHKCEGVDECAQAKPQCSHKCRNVDGHFACSCEEGYDQDAYMYLCYARGPEAMLFYTTSTEINYVKIKSKQHVTVMSDLKQAHGVTFDGKYLYWVETQEGHQAIMRAVFTDIQKTKQVLVNLGLEDPGDVALDWVGGLIYFSDVHRGTISACKVDGSICTTLRTNSKRPRYVTLAMKYGKMIWADWHHQPLLMWAHMDGSRPSPLAEGLQGFATGLALDAPNDRLYYVDRTVKVIKLDDKQSYSLFEEPFYHPYAIAVFENTIFWNDWISNSIQTADKLHGTGQKRNMLVASNMPIYGMHIYHPVLYNSMHNPCENHSCSHLCLASSNTTSVCACPDGMELNGTQCQHLQHYKPQYLVLGGGSSFSRVELNVLGNPEAHTTTFDIGRVQAMAFDSTRDTLYVYDGQRRIINYINMTEFKSGVTHLYMYRGLDDVVDMDYDYATDSLYILDAGRGFVEAVSLRTHKKALLLRFMDREVPVSFCVMPQYGRMLVAVLETEHGNEVHIDSIGLDGKDRKRILSTDLKGPKIRLRYDQSADVVYVADDGNGVIDLIHPEGTGRETFRQLSTTVTSMSVAEPHLFWTDRKTRLYWTNLHEASHYIRRIDLSIFPNNTHLYVQATSLPPDPSDPLTRHPCLTSQPCSDVCAQAPHAPLSHISRSSPKNQPSTPYTCLCTPGLLNINGQCTPLAHCKEHELYCHRSNICVLGKICNGVQECPQSEDEESCDVTPPPEDEGCSAGYIVCNNVCVQKDACDSLQAKIDQIYPGPELHCSENEFKCANATVCVERSQVCDGRPDCPGGWDEAPAVCDTLACHDHEFRCTSGSCILSGFQCDGEMDCSDGSDEFDCDGKTCSLGFFQCRNKECVEEMKRCDGQQDCVDMSDEEDCQSSPDEFEEEPEQHCPEGEIACELNRTICLPPTARCNMKVDCPGGTDEVGCDLRCAPHDLFECKQEYLCVERHRLCDGRKDCFDGSDETPEVCSTVNRTSRLYPPSLYPTAECHEGFLCGSGQCIEWRDVCDRVPHCFDGSDEHGLCDTACQNHSCAYSCQPTPQGAHCGCPPGLRTSADRQSCEDLDECAHHACSQLCRNVPGSFLCSCHHGYSLRPDRRSCKASKGDMSIVYLSGNTVWSMSADGLASVLYNDPKAAAIDDITMDIRRNKLYVTLTEAGKLVEVNNTKSSVVVTNIGKPTKVAVDWVTGNVYFVDSTPEDSCIRVCNVMKRRCAKLQKLPINSKVTALVVEPGSGRMFYCVGRAGRAVVWAATLAGRAGADLAAARACAGLTAAAADPRRLYVAETGPARIISMDYDGEDQKLIVYNHTDLQGLHDLALFEDSIYFLVGNTLNLNRCSLFGKKHCETFIHRAVTADTFLLRHETVQRDDIDNPCLGFDCSNVCVITEDGPRCVCDDGAISDKGDCPLIEKEQLPLFNGWTRDQYQRAQYATMGALIAVLALCALYLGVYIYYQLLHRKCATRQPYVQVRYQNRGGLETSAAATTVLEMPPAAAPSFGGHEFINPLQYVRDAWLNMRGEKRPIGTASLDVSIPYIQNDLSDTESDLDDRDTNKMVPRK